MKYILILIGLLAAWLLLRAFITAPLNPDWSRDDDIGPDGTRDNGTKS